MASVFLSYSREDIERAGSIALVLEKAGHSVWWDREIKGGAQYSKVIEEALRRADAVVVLWSDRSIESAWVRDEAAAGRDTGRLIPIKLNQAEPPMGFRQYQTIDLSRWRGRENSVELKAMLQAVSSLVEQATETMITPVPVASPRRVWPARNWVHYWWAAIPLIALVALLFWKPWNATITAPIVAVGPAENNAAATALARDLLVKLGNIQSAKKGAMRLVENREDLASKPDLLFEASGNKEVRPAQATLTLFAGRDRTLLWSDEFQSPNTADLNQQVAYTAALVLDCALEALNAGGKRLDQQALTLYLNGCAQHAELIGANEAKVVPIFLEVTERAPWFIPAWAKLLSAEVATASPSGSVEARTVVAHIRARIAQVRKLDPTMAEAVLAEAALLPKTALIERVKLIDRAIFKQPDNPNLLAARANLRGLVGRWREAVDDARLASELEPLSPGFRHSYILALAYAGQTETAFAELAMAERLWPGASNMIDARYRLHLRYGDPKEALRLLRTGRTNGSPSAELILIAKVDPTTENVERAKTLIRNAVERYPNQATGPLQSYPEFGIEDELYAVFSRWDRFEPEAMSILFRPAFRNFQKDPRFMRLAARSGLIGFWRDTGMWPDFCFDPDLPYDCKKEVAKLLA